MRHLEPQGDLQVIFLLTQNVYFLRETRGGYSTAPCGFETGGHDHATNHFLSANELMMFSQSRPWNCHCYGFLVGKSAEWATGDFSKSSNRAVHSFNHPTRTGTNLFMSLQISQFRFSQHSTGVGVRKPAVLSHEVHEHSKKGIVHGTRWGLKLHALDSHITFLALGMKFNRKKNESNWTSGDFCF